MTSTRNSSIFSPVPLPYGRVVSNRLVKVAMYEHLASFLGGPPNRNHLNLYSIWAKHDWGMIITGNVQVSDQHLSLGRDLVVPNDICEETLKPWRALARRIHNELDGKRMNETLAIMQLNHTGRQSPNILGGRFPFVPPLAPSDTRIGATSQDAGFISDLIHRILFQTPRQMSFEHVEQVIREFVKGAQLAAEAGFDGVQLHMAHGYLLAQFFSSKANTRTDNYCSQNALHLLYRIISAIRSEVRRDFVLGIKINTSDYSLSDTSGSKQEQEEKAFRHVCDIAQWRSVDFIEVSGGDYENPEFMMSSNSKSSRQAFFAQFSSRVKVALKEIEWEQSSTLDDHTQSRKPLPLIIVTGGLRSPAHVYTALSSDHTDLLGIGRPSLLCPGLPTVLRRLEASSESLFDNLTPFKSHPEPDLSFSFTQHWPWSRVWRFVPKIKLVGAGVGMAWYLIAARAWSTFDQSDEGDRLEEEEDQVVKNLYEISGIEAVIRMWIWVPEFQISVLWRSLALIVLLLSVNLFLFLK
ncbi:FMN-linked oxidoreductase [Dendrothele bispora CBS 962.96]|uniref:FMN-linked oxidoreductase n=1 Tax=Dendrothele bispora (strain CBS 962.96) TaxID=1314807 RepID=A0A4S8MAC6_DENBC|nr:FMN-linked oxidoreductase [Dendrothele bispora CBS 962.96]